MTSFFAAVSMALYAAGRSAAASSFLPSFTRERTVRIIVFMEVRTGRSSLRRTSFCFALLMADWMMGMAGSVGGGGGSRKEIEKIRCALTKAKISVR